MISKDFNDLSCTCRFILKIIVNTVSLCILRIYKPGNEKMCLMSYANNKGADQPVHLRSPISTFVVHCLDRVISLDSIVEISRL